MGNARLYHTAGFAPRSKITYVELLCYGENFIGFEQAVTVTATELHMGEPTAQDIVLTAVVLFTHKLGDFAF
jgi:hypothetical protein